MAEYEQLDRVELAALDAAEMDRCADLREVYHRMRGKWSQIYASFERPNRLLDRPRLQELAADLQGLAHELGVKAMRGTGDPAPQRKSA